MTKSPLSLTLLATATGLSFCTLPALADTYELADGEYTLASDAGSTTWAGDTFTISSNILNAENWGGEGYLGAWIGWGTRTSNSSLALGTSTDKVTITGSGFFGIVYGYSNGDVTVDLTNVDVSNFTGQICVVNQYNGNAIVKLSGDQWASVEYVFGSTTAEWAGVTTGDTGAWIGNKSFPGLFSRGTGGSADSSHEHDTLALQGATTFAGITGTSKDYTVGSNNFASEDFITVTTAGTKLTIAGSGTYAFYGTVGASGTEVSLAMDSKNGDVAGSGKQTFGGTNYLQDVTVSTGTLALDGTTSITGGVSVATNGALELGGEITLSSAITNSGSVTVADSTSFVLDNLTAIYDVSSGREYYELIISADTGSLTINDLTSLGFTLGGETIDWTAYTTGGSLYIYSSELASKNLIWSGTSGTNTWTTDSSVTDWTIANTTTSTSFATGDSVTFGPNTSSFNNTIVLGEDITASTVTISGTGYTLSGNHTMTATELVLDDEESGTNHTFTIASGTTVEVTKLTEDAGQLDLVVNGTLTITDEMHVDSSEGEVISGTGKLVAKTFNYDAAQGSSLTISVAQAEFESIYEKAPATDSNSNSYRSLIIGDGTSPTTVTAETMGLSGKSELRIEAGSTLTVGDLTDSSGYDTLISGDGSISIDSLAVSGNSTNGVSTFTISIANFESGDIAFTGTNSLTISSASFTADSIVFTGGNTGNTSGAGGITISSGANATVGLIQSETTHTLTVEDGATLTAGEIYRSGNTLNLAIDGTLTVTQLDGYDSSTGMIYFGKDGSTTSMAQTISGSGTVNAYGIEAGLSSGSLTISVANLNIGAGGITRYGSGSGTVNINGTKVGLYNTNASTISADVTIGTNGVTFNPESEGQTITLSGTVTGNGLVTKEGAGELAFTGTGSSLTNGLTVSAGTVSVATDASLTLGGTVTLASAISNSGAITIDSNTSFVLDNLTMGSGGGDGQRDYYVLITGGNGSSVTGNVTISNFTGGNIDSSTWSVWSDGLENGYLVIYGEATATPTASDLYWAGTEGNTTWTSGDSTVDWSNANDGNSGYYFQNGENVTFGSAAESKSVTIAEAITAGAITVDSAAYTWTFSGDGASVTANSLTLSGDEASLAITGEGTFTLGSTSDQSLAGEGSITIGDGTTLKLLENADDKYEDTSITITISSGGTLDVDGDGGTMFKLVLGGGTLTSSIDMAETKKQLPDITLTADSTVDASHNIGMLGSNYATTSLDLGSHTLTKTGDGNFFLENTTVTAGTIDVTEGTLTLYGTDASAATIKIAQDTILVVGSANNNYDSKVGTLTSSGTVDLKAGSTLEITGNSVISGTLSLETTNDVSSTLKVTNGANLTLNVTSTIVGSGSTLSVESSSSITLESTLAFKDSNSNVSGCVTFSDSAKLIIGGDLLAQLENTTLDTDDDAVAIIVANDISFGGTSVSEAGDDLDDLINAYVSAGNYLLTWTWNEGTLSASIVRAIPEPSMFGIIFGLSALGLVATRRRRRKAA